jgi:hypothetical protein
VICRLWHGWTEPADADAYERYLREELYPRLERELAGRGYRGYQILRRSEEAEVAFVTMTWFDSLAAVRGFAGDDYETAVITETAARLLARHEPRATHYELAAERLGPDSRRA